MDRDIIIDNIGRFSAQQIVKFLIAGDITVPELLREVPQDFRANMREEVDHELWSRVAEDGSSEKAHIYLKNFPSGRYADEARSMNPGASDETTRVYVEEAPDDDEEQTYVALEDDDEDWDVDYNDPWAQVDKSNKWSLFDFIENYPDSPYCREARKLISRIDRRENLPGGPEWLRQQLSESSQEPEVIAAVIIEAHNRGQIKTKELIDMIGEDNNMLSLETLTILIADGLITAEELARTGIDPDFTDILAGDHHNHINNPVETSHMKNPEYINQVCQEIYFWGMPSSGKTCALAAILSSASTGKIAKTIQKNPNCRGYDYMRQLSQVFDLDSISTLPTGTSTSFVSDMSFWLQDKKDRLHSITLIDLAGEMLYAMYLVDQGRYDDLTIDQKRGYNCMRNLLVDKQSKNSKIHFFVLEYGGHERREKGIRQVDMLDGALAHIQNLGILNNTDAVFLLITKSDKALKEEGNVMMNIKNYVETHYQAFYNNLKRYSQKINGGRSIELFPFSIGDVCFKDLCRFDDETANDLVSLFLERTVGEHTGKLGFINSKFRK